MLLQNGKYQIRRVLGQGGFGITYLADQPELQREVVIKVYHTGSEDAAGGSRFLSTVASRFEPGLPPHRASIESLLKEARLLSQVKHPHFVTIYDFFTEQGEAYIVMEYVVGATLREHIDRLLPWEAYVDWMIQVAKALEAIHDRGIIHRDIKPANILVRQETGEAVLIDMGIAMYTDPEGNTSFVAAGTPGYAAPEQASPELGKRPEVDVYGLGATLFHCLAGVVPPDSLLIANEGLPDLQESLPSDLRQAVKQALAFRQADRPSSIRAFRQTLEAVRNPVVKPEKEAEVPVVLVAPLKDTQKSPLFDRRWLVPGLLAVVVVVVVVALSAGSWWQGRREGATVPPILPDTNEHLPPVISTTIQQDSPVPSPAPSPLRHDSDMDRFGQDIFNSRQPLDARRAQLSEGIRAYFAPDGVVVTASISGEDTIVTEVKPVRAFFEGLMVVDGVTLRTLQTERDAVGLISAWTVQVTIPTP